MSLKVLYEDNHLLCVVKPVNIPVQADASGDEDFLTQCKAYIKEKYEKPGAVYLGLVHRLDRPVGGVMVFARTSKAADRLAKSMQKGEWHKEYLAVTQGRTPACARLLDYLVKDDATFSARVVKEGAPGAKPARLDYRCLAQGQGLSLLHVDLYTGRHHQIRAQLAHAGFPLWGDQRYNPAAKPGQQIALWAERLTFEHPVSREPVELIAPPPAEYPWDSFGEDAYELPLAVAYEDERLVALCKPQGMETTGDGSLEELAQLRWPDLRACHRLDAGTGGLLLFAKDGETEAELCSAIKERRVHKTYQCVVCGKPPKDRAELHAWLRKDAQAALVSISDSKSPGAKEIVARYSVERGGRCSLLRVELVTGRTHQIRAHLAHIGCPVLGDDKYGDREMNRQYGLRAQALWAMELDFGLEEDSPLSYLNKIHIVCPPMWDSGAILALEGKK